MPRSFSAASILAKNRVGETSPYLIALEITIPGEPVVYLINDAQDHTIGGNDYVAYPFTVDVVEVTTDGGAQEISVTVANPKHLLTQQIRDSDGFVGTTVVLRVVRMVRSGEVWTGTIEIEENYLVKNVSLAAETVQIRLGAENVLQRRFPPRVFLRNQFPGVPQ